MSEPTLETNIKITELRQALAEAWQNLARALQEECPGPHRYVSHRDTHPQWCGACRRTAGGEYIARPVDKTLPPRGKK